MTQSATSLNLADVERDELPVDVLVVGAGPAGLACALDLARRFAADGDTEKTILVIDKAEELGNHTLSGAVMDPAGIDALIPDWREKGFPVLAEIQEDWAEMLRPGGGSLPLRGMFCPPQLQNHGNLIVSLNQIVRWLGERAEEAGIEVYGGFPAAELIREENNRIGGVITRDSGIAKDGSKKATYEPGMRITADVTVFAEGTRGSIAKELLSDATLGLMEGKNPQTYGTGIKELWEVTPEVGAEFEGKVMHTGGYPLDLKSYGGSWVYGLPNNRLSLGFVVGLDHGDAALDAHALFVQWKQHPRIAKLIEGGKVVRYGAKTVPEGGLFSMPKLFGNGFVMVGDSAGFLNAATLKGIHLGIQSGMLAAEAIFDCLKAGDTTESGLVRYDDLFQKSAAHAELSGVRNYRQAMTGGVMKGVFDFAVQRITGGRGLVEKRGGHSDHDCMQPAAKSRLQKPAFNDSNSMDKLTDVYLSGAVHEEDQPSHLLVLDPTICVDRCTAEYGNPCQHFCPAAVYEWPTGASEVLINASNCVHCKTCDIADPYENINWTVPEGGGGPKYQDM